MSLIRRATPWDLDVIVEFSHLLAEETEGKNLDLDQLRSGTAACLADPHKGLYFVAEDKGEVIGQIMITTEWSDWSNGWRWWIQNVYIRRDHRRRGVFQALFSHVYQAALRDPEVIGLRLCVERDNQGAQQIYHRLGMKPINYLIFEKHLNEHENANQRGMV